MSKVANAILTEVDLEVALAEGRFILHYQPQYTSRESRLVGVEALVRLLDRDGQIVPPGQFIAGVERLDLIHHLGAALFERGCADAVQWPDITVAINVSPAQFRDPGLADRLIGISQSIGVDPRRIEIEITEGLFFDDPVRAEAALRRLSAFGFGIALDDFGTGYSSLGYLLRFPVSKVKIDQSFVAGLPHDVRSASIVHAIVALCRALGLKVVAEGVETEGQRTFLRVAGCHLLQGYLLGAAVPAGAISDLVDRRRIVATG